MPQEPGLPRELRCPKANLDGLRFNSGNLPLHLLLDALWP